MHADATRGVTMQLPEICQETLSTARGDERDDLETQRHLAACADCRDEIAEIQAFAHLARAATATATPSSRFRLETVARARRRPAWLGVPMRVALAAAATVAVAVSWKSTPATSYATNAPIRLTIDAATADTGGLEVEVAGPLGRERTRMLPETRFVLETVAVNAMVVDTFRTRTIWPSRMR